MKHPGSVLILLGLWIGALSSPALAVDIPVRSAEHDDFTRLVLDLPRALEWAVESTETGQRIRLEGVTPQFDLSDSFRRITSDRISGIAPSGDGKGLDISLNCDCALETFLLNRRMLVVDIRDAAAAGANRPGSRDTATPTPNRTTARSAAGRIESRFTFPFEHSAPTDPLLSGVGPLSVIADTATEHNRGTEPNASHTATQAHPPSGTALSADDQIAETHRLSAAERRLATQLGRAATQGLVTPRSKGALPYPPPDHNSAQAQQAGHGQETGKQKDLPEDLPQALPGVNLRAVTSADSAFLDMLNAIPRNRDGDPCFQDSDLAIADWGSNQGFTAAVGRLRGDLAGEFDRPDPATVTRLAKLYIHYGFGAEAGHVLDQGGIPDREAHRLRAMADVMEYGHARQPAIFADQFDCDSSAALWATLAFAHLPSGAAPDTRAIARSINAMPPRLRQLLGPMVSDRLVETGEEAAAAEILSMVARGMDRPDPGYEMASARLHIAEGEVAPAHGALENVISANTELSPKALIELIDSRLNHGEEIDSETAGLAGAYAREYKRDPLGSELQRVHILALSAVGAFDDAFKTMEAFVEDTDAATALRLRSYAMEALAQDAGDIPFLKYATATGMPDRTHLDPAAGNAVAGRLLDMGFPDVAANYLAAPVEPPFARERALLRARAALGTGRPKLAEAELLGTSGEDADLLRARARSLSGDHRAASRLFADLDQTSDATQQAFLASDWDSLRQTDDQFWQDVAGLVQPATRPTADGEEAVFPGPLARDRALLEGSAETRRTMDSLLARLALDPPPSRTGEE